jgi:hypothetical protein
MLVVRIVMNALTFEKNFGIFDRHMKVQTHPT